MSHIYIYIYTSNRSTTTTTTTDNISYIRVWFWLLSSATTTNIEVNCVLGIMYTYICTIKLRIFRKILPFDVCMRSTHNAIEHNKTKSILYGRPGVKIFSFYKMKFKRKSFATHTHIHIGTMHNDIVMVV